MKLRLGLALAAAILVAAVLFAPVGQTGYCAVAPASGASFCDTGARSLVGIDTSLWLWLGATVAFIALAWWLAHTRSRFRVVVEAVVALPIVLPPTVLGFYILVALGPYGPIGHFTGLTLAFTFWGLVIGSAFYSMPFVIQPLHAAFEAVGKAPLEAQKRLPHRRDRGNDRRRLADLLIA